MTLVPTGKYERMEAELLQLRAQNAALQEKLDGSIHVMGEGGFLQTGILPGKSRDFLALAMDKAATNGVAKLQNKTRFKNWVHVPQGTKSDDEISRMHRNQKAAGVARVIEISAMGPKSLRLLAKKLGGM